MARRKLNKSEAIRSEITKHPRASTSGVVQLLGEQGIQVTPQLVSNVKTRMSAGAGKKRGRKPGRGVSGALTIEKLEVAAEFARQMGGVELANAALATLERLR
jgi:hypothetical protein